MGSKLQAHHPQEELAPLTRERLLQLMPAEDADELLSSARGEPVASVSMSADDFESWCVDGPDDPFSKP